MISGQPNFTITSRWNSSYFIGGFENDLWNMYNESLGIMSGPLYVFSKCLSSSPYHHHCNMPEGIFLWRVIETENLYSTHFPPFLKVMYWISSHCLVYNGMPPMAGSSLLLEQGFQPCDWWHLDGSFFVVGDCSLNCWVFSIPGQGGKIVPVFHKVLTVSKFFLRLSGSLLSYFSHPILSFGDM